MRHGDINMTMSMYSHIFRGQDSEAVENLLDLSLPSSQNQKNVKTGTDDVTTYDVLASHLTVFAVLVYVVAWVVAMV